MDRYLEALEQARNYYPDNLFLDTIFPELADSEDERIRKNLHNFFLNAKLRKQNLGVGVSNEKILTYLEKQKEQKPVHTAKEMWKEMRLEVYAQASGNRHEPNYSDDSTKMFSLCDIDEIFEKIGNSTVGSQPAEWSDEDVSIIVSRLKDAYEETQNEMFLEDIERIKSLRPQPHWKPSEEQMEMLSYVVEGRSDLCGDVLRSLYNELKKL